MKNLLADSSPPNLSAIQQRGLPGFLGGQNIGDFINNSKILDFVFGAAGIALLVYLVLGGLQLMLSRGDPKAIQGAQAKITNALIGFLIVIVAFFIVQFFGQVFRLQGTTFGSLFNVR